MDEPSGQIQDLSRDQMVVLKDGRSLGFSTSGSPDGIPVFLFHGTPGSRLGYSPDEKFNNLPGVFMIFPERPGYGISSPKPDRTLTDWPDDVIELADQLGLARFAVAGGSGGGPHVLACAWKNPERVFAAFIFGSPMPVESLKETKGMAFGNRINFYIGTRMPWLIRFVLKSNARTLMKNPNKYLQAVAKQMDPSDRIVLEDENARAAIIEHLKEAYRQGSEAQFIDGQLTMTTRPWGFSLGDIRIPVHGWHGENDTLVPKSLARRYSEIPGANVRIVPNVGHLLTENAEVVDEFENALRKEWRRAQ